MDAKEFRQAGREMVDYLADYLENIHERQVLPKVVPGYMKDLLPSDPPEEAESWDKIMPDIERVIMPGVSNTITSFILQWNLSVTTTSIKKYITCDLFSNVF